MTGGPQPNSGTQNNMSNGIGSMPTSGGPGNVGGIGAMSGPQAAAQLAQAIPGGQGGITAGAIGNAINGQGGNAPPWMKGLQLGQQLSQMQGQHPQAPPMAPHPMMGGAPGAGGMPSGVVPGTQGMAPPVPSGAPGMATAGQGMPMTNTGQQQMNPQLMQLMRARGLM